MVADGLEMVEFQAGQAIFEQGEAGDKFFIIREGTGERLAWLVHTYGWLYESCMGSAHPWLAM